MGKTETQAAAPGPSSADAAKTNHRHNGNGTNGVGAHENTAAHPWAHLIGSMKNDPTWDEYMAIMAENQRKDQEEFNAQLEVEEARKKQPV